MKRLIIFFGLKIFTTVLILPPQFTHATLYVPESPYKLVSRMLKVDSLGDTVWARTYEKGFLNNMLLTEDSGYIFTGSFLDSSINRFYLWLLKTDSLGEVQWSRVYNYYKNCLGHSIQQTVGGGYLILGRIDTVTPFGGYNSNMWLLNVDSIGDTLWTRYKDSFSAECLQNTSDGSFLILGNPLDSEKRGTYTLHRFDNEDNTIWIKTLGGNSIEYGNYIEQTIDGGFIITGSRKRNIMLLKIDSKGNKVWRRNWGKETIDRGYYVHQTSDTGFIVAGEIRNDFHLIKTDSNGKINWMKNYTEECNGRAKCVQETGDGGFVVLGYKGGKVWFFKTDTDGKVLWERRYFSGSGGDIQQSEKGDYIILALEKIEL